jgi:UDP:flavonoid glycosyltransferase YjiC (YdhE family)
MGPSIDSKYNKPRILFICEDVALSHVVRPLVLAQTIRDSHEICVAAGDKYAELLKSSNVDYRSIWTLSADLFVERLAKGQDSWFAEDVSQETEADIALINEFEPDLVIGDLRWSLGISAAVTNTPHLSFLNAHWSPYYTGTRPPMELPTTKLLGVKLTGLLIPILAPILLKKYAKPFNAVRREYGLDEVFNYLHIGVCADWVAYLDIPSLGPTKDAPSTHTYLGPVDWSPDVTHPDWWEKLPDDKPIAYVSMGSTGKINYIHELVETLTDMGMTVMLSTSGRYEQEGFGDNVYIAEYLPGLEACRRSNLVVCNGGTGAIYQAIQAEVPILGIPTNGDQYFAMGSAENNKAGILVRSTHVNRKRIRAAGSKLLSDSSYKQRCSELRAELHQYGAVARFPEFVDSLFRSR